MNKKGFTLIELLVVISILALIIVIVATNGFGAFNTSKYKISELAQAEIEEALNVLMTEIEYCDDNDKDFLEDISEKLTGNKDTYKTCIDLQKASSQYKDLNNNILLEGKLNITLDSLIKGSYATGSNAKKLYEKNKDNNIEYEVYFELSDSSFEKDESGNIKTDDNGDVILKDFVVLDKNISCINCSEIDTNLTGEKRKLLKNVVINSAKQAKEEGSRTRTIFYGETDTLPTIPGQSASGENERVLAITDDDLGKSYYFRGNVIDNYVEFNNMCFRIVRIEGDGSVKIILAKQDLCSTITDSDVESAIIGGSSYGYRSDAQSGGIFPDYQNNNNSNEVLKYMLEDWYDKKLSNVSNLINTKNICIGDETVKYDSYGNQVDLGVEYEDDILGFVGYEWYYDNYKRIEIDKTPSFKCGMRSTVSTNSKIFPLTVDEVVFAGLSTESSSLNSYLLDNARSNDTHFDLAWWTISLSHIFSSNGLMSSDGDAYLVRTTKNDAKIESYFVGNIWDGLMSTYSSVRPVISLISGIEINSGDGTKNNPYVIK